jgi:hypothetical protein
LNPNRVHASRQLSFEVPTVANPGALARRQLDYVADQMDHSNFARLRLLVSELVNRAAGDPERASVTVSVTVSPAGIHAVVLDDSSDGPQVLDWALLLVSRIADRWGVAHGIWFELEYSAAPGG